MTHLDQFPMFRFATLLARQLSSPIANRLKVYARDHPVFGRVVCARVGRWYRTADVRLKMWSLRLAAPRAPLVISDREAIDLGTDLLGEMILFSLGALIIIFEVNRQAMKQEAKKLDKRSRWVAIRMSLEELKVELETQQKEIDLLLAAIRELDPDVPLPQPSSLAKPLPQDPEPAPPMTSLMKPLPQPTPDPHKPPPQSSPERIVPPSNSTVTRPLPQPAPETHSDKPNPQSSPEATLPPLHSTFTKPFLQPSPKTHSDKSSQRTPEKTVSPKQPTVTNPLQPGAELMPPSSDQPASIHLSPVVPDSPSRPVVHPPGCVCVVPAPPPPSKPLCPPKIPPPKACD